MRQLTCADIHNHQTQVTEQSRAFFGPMYGKFDDAIDALLIIQYAFIVPDQAVPTALQRVQMLAQKWLYLSIFSFHASLSLAEQGFYSQSIILNRNLLEHLVTVRYLADKPDQIDRLQMVSKRVPNAVTLRHRFDYVIPGYYELHYKFSSEFSHPSHGSHVLKIQPDGAGGYIVDMGISFNPELMSLCLNELAMLLAGFLKAYSTKFRSALQYRSTPDIEHVRASIAALLELLYAHIALKGGENTWHSTTRPLWDW